MSSKNTSNIEYKIFTSNIRQLVEKAGGKKELSAIIGVNYDTVRRWCLGEFLPSGNQLLTIKEKFGISIDWLLTGREPGLEDLPEEISKVMSDLKEILVNAPDVFVTSVLSNISAVKYAMQNRGKKDYCTVDKENPKHRGKTFLPGVPTGIGKAASTGTK